MNFVFREALKSEPARFEVSFKVTRMPFSELDLKNKNIMETIIK